MITPLKKTALHDLLNKPVLFDANIFMVGISDRVSDKNCSFENMKKLYIEHNGPGASHRDYRF